MDDTVVRKTQETLGKIIKKPPLTEKLLKKPPFRFLHDIMTCTIKATGFMKGLFTESEMQSDNIKDKEAKMAFLQKAIDIVQLATGQSLSVRTSKIVAGHEPEKTNEFLQALAAATSKKSKNDELVQKVLKGETSSSSSKKEKEKERDTSADRRERKESSKKEKAPERKSSRDERPERKSSRDERDRDGSRDREQNKENRDESRRRRGEKRESVDNGKSSEKIKTEDERPPRPEKTSKENGHQESNDKPGDSDDDDEDGQAARIPRPASAKGARRRQREGKDHSKEREEPEKPAEEERPAPARSGRSARPSSARPAPPKPKKQQETVPEPEIRIGSGKPITQLIVDDQQNSDDDDNFVVEDSGPPEPQAPLKPEGEGNEENEAEHGGLVKKILETKKELEGGSQQPQAKKVEIEKPAMSDVARRKEREMVMKEIETLRGSIQGLTRSANPLGKIMDYVQEDMDSMQNELEKWKQENKEHALALKREQGVTESSIEPLRGQLSELDQAISDQLILIAASKANILRNDSKISKMLGSVTKS